MGGGRHPRQFHLAIGGRALRLLSRAIARVPSGRVLDREAAQGRRWDTNTGLFLRPKRG